MNYELKQTTTFTKWFKSLKDTQARYRIMNRLNMIRTDGNFGDYKSVGDSVSELRIFTGKGYRVYYTLRNKQIVLLLAGSDKDSQQIVIAKAKRLLIQIKNQAGDN